MLDDVEERDHAEKASRKEAIREGPETDAVGIARGRDRHRGRGHVETPGLVPERERRLEAGAGAASHVEEAGTGLAWRKKREAPDESADEEGLHGGIRGVSAFGPAFLPVVLRPVQTGHVARVNARGEIAHRTGCAIDDAVWRKRGARVLRRRLTAERARARFEAERGGRSHRRHSDPIRRGKGRFCGVALTVSIPDPRGRPRHEARGEG